MSPLLIGLYTCHVLAAIVWFGGGLTSVLVTGPAIGRSGEAARAEISPHIGEAARRVYPLAGLLTIVAGVLLAVVSGRVSTTEEIVSPYGLTVTCALGLTLAVYAYGARVVGPAMGRLQSLPPAERPAALKRGLRAVALEQFGFLAVFACMALMRFGM